MTQLPMSKTTIERETAPEKRARPHSLAERERTADPNMSPATVGLRSTPTTVASLASCASPLEHHPGHHRFHHEHLRRIHHRRRIQLQCVRNQRKRRAPCEANRHPCKLRVVRNVPGNLISGVLPNKNCRELVQQNAGIPVPRQGT